MGNKKTILVAPLNWGLGHATRCIPIIKELMESGFQPLLGSDGAALALLRKEFPELPFCTLPSYKIEYAKKASAFKWKLLLNSSQMLQAMRKEKKVVEKLVASNQIQGIISDNRLGVRSKKVPSVFLTHQVQVLSGNTTWLSTKLHQNIIRKYDVCWVPDLEGPINFSGKLGHPTKTNLHIEYIGALSRMQSLSLKKEYDVLVLLSGPEPQRSLLEQKLHFELGKTTKKCLFVLGKVEGECRSYTKDNFTYYNYMSTELLEKAINASELVISRSGYTTIMDLAVLEKKAFFIPTPGQYEQEYLAKRLRAHGFVPSCKQDVFDAKKLDGGALFQGLSNLGGKKDLHNFFRLFEGK